MKRGHWPLLAVVVVLLGLAACCAPGVAAAPSAVTPEAAHHDAVVRRRSCNRMLGTAFNGGAASGLAVNSIPRTNARRAFPA